MAATIQDSDLTNKNTTQGSNATNQVDPSTQNKSDASNQANQDAVGQIAQNYGGNSAPQQQSDNQAVTQQNSNPSQQKGTGYTNIQNIVNANKNNGLANAIGGGIQKVGQQAENDISNQQTAFGQQSATNQANTGANQQLIGNVLNNAQNYTGANAQPGANQFQQLLSGVYQGPTGLANSQQIQSEAGDVGQLNKSLSSPGGQQSLLQRFVGNPGYNQGEQTLDTLLLGQGDQSALNSAKGATAGLQNKANNAITGAQAQAQQYANQAQQFGQGAQNQLGQYVNQQNNMLTQNAQDAQNKRDAQVQALQSAANGGQLNQTLANQLGITSPDGLTYGINAGNYITENAQKANAQNIADASQYGNLNALSQLAGSYAPQAAQATLGQFNNPTQAGTFNKANAYNVDQPGFQNAFNSAQNTYNSTLNPTEDQTRTAQDINSLAQAGDVDAILQKYPTLRAGIQSTHDAKDQLDNLKSWAQNNLSQAQANQLATQQQLNNEYGTTTYSINPDGTSNS